MPEILEGAPALSVVREDVRALLRDRVCSCTRVTRYGGSISRMTMHPVILSV